jgi:pimeloyl-ACP methyl ester carboxylesterase
MHDWRHREIDVNNVRLHYVESGQGEPVVLLHGFPEFWYSWRRQLPALAAAGFRAMAVDLRGYNLSSKPRGVANYRMAALVNDLAAFIRMVAGGRALIVGHDWGGVLAWRLAALHPELTRKLAVLNAPHPARMRQVLRRNPMQWLRSWYVLLFQLPWLPERLLRARDFVLLERAFRREPINPAAFSAEDIAEYKAMLGQPGGLTAALHYYRAAMRYPGDLYDKPQSVAPTLVIWGCRDPHLGVSLTERLGPWVPDLRVERLAGASHWVQNDAPEQVNELLIGFFRGDETHPQTSTPRA